MTNKKTPLEKAKSNFAKNLVELRKKVGLTQSGLAKKIGFSRETIYKYECGELPKPDNLSILTNFFEVTIFELFN